MGAIFCVSDWEGSGRRREVRQNPPGRWRGQPPLTRGPFFARAKPAGGASLVKGRCRAQARRRDSRPSAGVTGNPARPVGIPQSPNGDSPPLTRGPFLRGRSPREKPPLTGEVAERQRWPEGLWRFAAAGSCGGVKTPPYGAKDTWAVMARLRAGHARPLQTATNGLRTRGAREGGSPPPFPLTGW